MKDRRKKTPKPYSVKEMIIRTASVSSLFVTFGTCHFGTFATCNLCNYLLLFTHLPLVKPITSVKRPFCFGGKRIFPLEIIIFTLHCLFSLLGLLFLNYQWNTEIKEHFIVPHSSKYFALLPPADPSTCTVLTHLLLLWSLYKML